MPERVILAPRLLPSHKSEPVKGHFVQTVLIVTDWGPFVFLLLWVSVTITLKPKYEPKSHFNPEGGSSILLRYVGILLRRL
jgi:hypothetical protein